MNEPAAKPKRPLRKRAVSAWRGLAPFARPHRRALVPGILGAVGVVAARLAFPWPLRGVLELTLHKTGGRGAIVAQLVPAGGDPAIWLTGTFVAIIIVWALAEYAQRLAFARFAAGTVRDARAAAIERLEVDGGGSRDPGELLARIMGDSARVKSGIRGVLIGTTRNGIFFFGVSTIVLLIDTKIGLVFIGGGLVSVFVACIGARNAARLSRKFRRRESALTGRLHDLLTRDGDRGRDHDPDQDQPPAEPGRVKAAGRPALATLNRSEGFTTIAIHLVLAISTCGILVLAIDAARSRAVSPGAIFIVLIYVTLMHNKTVAFGRMIVRSGRVLTSAERLAAVAAPDTAGHPIPERPSPASPLGPTAQPPGPEHPPGDGLAGVEISLGRGAAARPTDEILRELQALRNERA